MIEFLKIENLILIEKAEITFGPHLNILTGETGAGKSAVLSAIHLILGERADLQLIRNGADFAVVEARVKIAHRNSAIPLPSPSESILVRRELYRSGRNRIFVDDQLVSLQELKSIIGRSIELVDQSSAHFLSDEGVQRQLLDLYASSPDFTPHFERQIEAESKLSQLLIKQKTGLERQKAIEEDLKILEEIDYKDGEEEILAADHALLTHAQDLVEKISEVVFLLSEGSQPILPLLKRKIYQFENLLDIAPQLREAVGLLKNGTLELEEAACGLVAQADCLDTDPHRLSYIEERIGQIESLKRRFGAAFIEKKKQLQDELDGIVHLDEDIDTVRNLLKKIQSENHLFLHELTQMRKSASEHLTKEVSKELQSLNLGHGHFVITVQPKLICSHGSDAIHFLFTANPGSPLSSLSEVSGGELSRLLFAIKTALASRDQSSCLIFDEIDSNVGGETAALLGAKLEKMSSVRQLICVTHFVQVAKRAKNHYLVAKSTHSSGAITTVTQLNSNNRQNEFDRMIGNFSIRKSEAHIESEFGLGCS